VFFAITAQAEEGQRLRIVSIAPNVTEILFELGLDEEVVGCDNSSDYPAAARRKEKIGSFDRPNIEKIVSLKPDIVFTTSIEQKPAVEKLVSLGLRVVVIYPKDIEGLCSDIERIGELTDRQKQAQDLSAHIIKETVKIKALTDKIPQENRPGVFLEIWNDPVITAGSSSFVGQMIEAAGGRNIAYDAGRDYSRFSAELVLERNPDVIILAYMDSSEIAVENLKQRFGWDNINAVKTGRVYNDIDPDIILRPGPRIVEGLAKLYEKFYKDK